MKKHLRFAELEPAPKTKKYKVISNHDDTELGIIQWHGAWRQYILNPDMQHDLVWSWDCLLEASEFIRFLNDERKKDKPGMKPKMFLDYFENAVLIDNKEKTVWSVKDGKIKAYDSSHYNRLAEDLQIGDMTDDTN